jgi:hypothetical protein
MKTRFVKLLRDQNVKTISHAMLGRPATGRRARIVLTAVSVFSAPGHSPIFTHFIVSGWCPLFAQPIVVRRRLEPLDEAERRRHKIRNVAHSILLLGGIIVLLGLCGWVLFGPDGLIGMALGAALAFAFSPQISPQLVLRLYRAREIGPRDLPEVMQVLAALAGRAGQIRFSGILM